MAHIDELRLMTKVARMYYEENKELADMAIHAADEIEKSPRGKAIVKNIKCKVG